ncbi:hypothetical protein RNJ44_03057 [Nakaseomyces bracarensis]|uniref:WKF domain-containing protein n=1 Tax=Nakaseomyces bracarensis TaxID=273131 RepID=A0ABR4NYP9_9SACH
MSDHVPAWKRFAIKRSAQESTSGADVDADPLNVTTHLATGSLTKKQKRSIINGDDGAKDTTKKEKKKNGNKKKEKLSREERETKRQKVLKDQLRYLIEFYLRDMDHLPEPLYELESVRSNYSDEDIKGRQNGETAVVDVWKFSKQKQNWLLKHFHSVDEIPIQYDTLLVQYFKDMKGRSKAELAKTCNEKLESWNQYLQDQEEKMARIINDDKAGEKKEEDEEKKGDESQDETKSEDKKEEEVELIMPNKEIIARSYKLLKSWKDNRSKDEPELEVVELYKFPEEELQS